jgi:hypothetical protein
MSVVTHLEGRFFRRLLMSKGCLLSYWIQALNRFRLKNLFLIVDVMFMLIVNESVR